ncbi:hypothetical protein LJ737_12530 [Hymenobacter sp. 15J16-1T3B]|uniref:hypothetical protein n=1 Tax=Hymenobacter sp. 15J16-1T3B TaxID=2886941 RepID=UPI001D10D932|nr:hypothetical protein [Hymenobacter sp. 15J16-1T3B]MCC3158068.1 hypothetical protein [Hymenobacter sp. 15J16-1T3B]
MTATSTLSRGLLLAYVLLTIYCLGVAIFTEWAELRSASDVSSYLSAADLAAWQMASTDNTALLLTVLSGVQTAALLALVWLLPASVPRGVLWAALICHVVVWALGLLARLPAGSFGAADPSLVELLVRSGWGRKLVLLIEAPLALYMAFRAFWPAAAGAGRPALPGKAPALS